MQMSAELSRPHEVSDLKSLLDRGVLWHNNYAALLGLLQQLIKA